MNNQDIEEIVVAANQAMTNAIKTQFAESFEKMYKRNRFSFNNNLIVVFAAVALLIAGFWFVTNSLKDNQDANTMTLVTAIDDVNQSVLNGDADIIAGLDTVNVKVDEVEGRINQLQGQTDTVIQQNAKIIQKQESLSSLLRKAHGDKIRKYRICLQKLATPVFWEDGSMSTTYYEDDVRVCMIHLK